MKVPRFVPVLMLGLLAGAALMGAGMLRWYRAVPAASTVIADPAVKNVVGIHLDLDSTAVMIGAWKSQIGQRYPNAQLIEVLVTAPGLRREMTFAEFRKRMEWPGVPSTRARTRDRNVP